MESTGNYHTPVAWLLHDAGLYVSVVNAMLVHDYGNNSLRRAKTDKKDAVKLANYGLDNWLTLPRYAPEEDTRLLLKNCYRQYQQYSKVQTMLKNNLSALLDVVFPEANRWMNLVSIYGQKAFRRQALPCVHDGPRQQIPAYLLRLSNRSSKRTGANLIPYRIPLADRRFDFESLSGLFCTPISMN